MKRDIFLRLPQPMAMLLLSAILNLGTAHKVYLLPRQTIHSSQPTTTTLSHHVIDAVPFPPLPTTPPKFRADLLRRQGLNTICGYIGGDPNLPATCGAGSHCVLDTQHGAIGCCPDGEPTCTTGVFTGCVDGNSPPQTEVNPYVFTCGGGDVCYQNAFEGGFFQFGCGTASDLATSVFATATGITETLDRPSVTFSFTETARTLSEPTTLGTVTVPTSTEKPTSTGTTSQTSNTEVSSSASSMTSQSSSSKTSSQSSSRTSSTRSTTTSSSSSSSKSSETSSLTSPTSNLITSTPTSAPSDNESKSRDQTGAIVGGTISGVAVLIGAIALGIYLWKRKKRAASNARVDAQGGPTEYISPMQDSSYQGAGFAPLHQDQEGWETGMTPGMMAAVGGAGIGAGGSLYPGHPGRDFSYPPARTGYDYPSPYPGGESSATGAATGLGGGLPPPRPDRGVNERDMGDRVPLTREIDDFSRGFHDALGRIGEEDEYDSSPNNGGTGVNEGNGVNGPNGNGHGHGHGADDGAEGPYGGVRPLWQQHRRQSRNLMWM